MMMRLGGHICTGRTNKTRSLVSTPSELQPMLVNRTSPSHKHGEFLARWESFQSHDSNDKHHEIGRAHV